MSRSLIQRIDQLASPARIEEALPQGRIDSKYLDRVLAKMDRPKWMTDQWKRNVLRLLLAREVDAGRIEHIDALAPILDRDLLQKCLSRGMSIDAQDAKSGSSLIHSVIKEMDLAYKDELNRIEAGAPIMDEGRAENLLEVALILLDKGADLSLSNKAGAIPLHRIASAIIDDHTLPLIQEVIQQSDVNTQTVEGYTALMIAAGTEETEHNTLNRTQIFDLLLNAGANPMLRNEEGMTAADLAEEIGDDRAARYLRQKEREFREQAQGVIVARTRNRQSAQVFPTAIAKRITNFLGGRRTHRKGKKYLKRQKTRKSRKG
jgi:hypothetical protein